MTSFDDDAAAPAGSSEQPPVSSSAAAANAGESSDPKPQITGDEASKDNDKDAAAAAAPDEAPRKDSLSIEPTDTTSKPSTAPETPVCQITLLLPTSARHPYKIDEKYLAKRNVVTPSLTEDGKSDPFSISVYTLKELILREWRPEWDTAPVSPGSIRLIFFGKLLDDKMPLKEYNFSHDVSNIIHMSIKPPETDEDEQAKGGKSGSGRGESAGCGCCIIL